MAQGNNVSHSLTPTPSYLVELNYGLDYDELPEFFPPFLSGRWQNGFLVSFFSHLPPALSR